MTFKLLALFTAIAPGLAALVLTSRDRRACRHCDRHRNLLYLRMCAYCLDHAVHHYRHSGYATSLDFDTWARRGAQCRRSGRCPA